MSVSDVAASSATFSATVNPEGAATAYTFEYAPSAGPFTPVPEPGGNGSIAGGTTSVSVGVHVQHGLLTDTAYKFRLVASNSVETVTSEPVTFTTQGAGAFALLDGRQWEMVSPPDKHGALLEPISAQGVIQAADGGDAVTYLADYPTESAPQGYSNVVQVFSTRGSGGWRSQDIATPHEAQTGTEPGRGDEYRFFSEDLSHGVLQPFGGFIPASSPDALAPEEASEQTAFLRTDFLNANVNEPCLPMTMHCYRPLVSGCPAVGQPCASGVEEHANVPPGTVFGQGTEEVVEHLPCPPALICGPEFVGASTDATHVVLSSQAQLTSAANGGEGLYEWSSGALSLVSVLPEGEGGGSASFPVLGDRAEDVRGAISADGSRVFWSTRGGGERLYMSEPAKGKAVRLDAVQGGPGGEEPSQAEFQLASRDGSRVFFRDTQLLTSDSGGRDLYECEIVEEAGHPKCNLSDLTPLSSKKEGAGVPGSVLGVNEEACDVGSGRECSVYFVANGVLENNGVPVAGAVHGTCSGEGGQPEAICNLYVRRGGTTRLVAVLSGADAPDWGHTGIQPSLDGMTSRVSPNGRWLAFMSQRQLTGYDNRDAVSGEPDEEVYLYDADTEKLACASCNPTGARPVGVTYQQLEREPAGQGGWETSSWLAASVPGWTPYRLSKALYQSRYLSESGRLFFNSRDALVPQDVNGSEDVYEFEPVGVGGCAISSTSFNPRSDGCVGLVSSGSSVDESGFLDAGESGGDVFFLTTAKLSPQDFDHSLDVYDAHECTSAVPCFPASAVAPPPCTSGDSCKPAPFPQPGIFGSPASVTFSGVGNAIARSTPVVTSKSLTRAQKLAALKACKKKRNKRKRVACERNVRKQYGAKASRKANAKRGGKR